MEALISAPLSKQCMFEFLIDTLNGGEALQSLNRLLKSAIRRATPTTDSNSSRHAPKLANIRQRKSNSFSFDEMKPTCEFTFTTVVNRILQQQQQTGSQQSESNATVSFENTVQQLVGFIEKAWYAVNRILPKPLRDGGLCQQKPHEMLTWIELIGDIADEAIDQLSRKSS